MGMQYDEKAGCWRLDLPCRINGKPTHLKDSVYGPRRQTQAEAMQRWLDLNTRAKDPAGSLTFGEDCDRYIKENPRIGQGIRSIIGHLKTGMGTTKRRDFGPRFEEWIKLQEKRKVRKFIRRDMIGLDKNERRRHRRMHPGVKPEWVEIDKPVSPSTIQSYKRYAKIIARANGYGEAFKNVTIGKRSIRRRPVEAWEMLQLEDVILKNFSWFFPAFDFARRNPIRPEDQFNLTVEDHVKSGKIIYAPKKTYSKTGLMAYPIMWPELQPWFENLTSGLLFPGPDKKPMMSGTNRYYDYIWGKICEKAKVKNLQYYDLRHHAVALSRSRGVKDWRIIKAAGWSGPEMIADYDPDNRGLIDEYDSTLLKLVGNCSTGSSTENKKTPESLGFSNESY